MSDPNVDQINAAIDQLQAARERMKQELLRQQSELRRGESVDPRPLNAIYKQSYMIALNTLRSLPPETPRLREAVGAFLLSDLELLQSVGTSEPEKLLKRSIDEIVQEQVKYAYVMYERAGKSVPAFTNLLLVYEEALVVGANESTLVMKKAKMAVNGVANTMKF